MKNYLLFAVTFMLIGCSPPKKPIIAWCLENKIPNETKVSFKELVKSKDFDGKTISIEGYFSFNFEDIALYDKQKPKYKGIWLNFYTELLRNDSILRKLNGKRIIITGTVDLSMKGHLNRYYCSLNNISCIMQ